MRWRLPLLATFVVVAGSCDDPVRPKEYEEWVADLVASQRVLFIRYKSLTSPIVGDGALVPLTGGSAEPLKLSGTRVHDTLTMVVGRPNGINFNLRAYYVGTARLNAFLDGGEFSNFNVSFRRP